MNRKPRNMEYYERLINTSKKLLDSCDGISEDRKYILVTGIILMHEFLKEDNDYKKHYKTLRNNLTHQGEELIGMFTIENRDEGFIYKGIFMGDENIEERYEELYKLFEEKSCQ